MKSNKISVASAILIVICLILPAKSDGQVPAIDSLASKNKSRTVLKAAAAVGIAALSWKYQDELREFDTKHDRIAHVVLGYSMTKLLGWKFASGFLFAIELTQIDIYGIEGRERDTALDLMSGGVGIGFAIKF